MDCENKVFECQPTWGEHAKSRPHLPFACKDNAGNAFRSNSEIPIPIRYWKDIVLVFSGLEMKTQTTTLLGPFSTLWQRGTEVAFVLCKSVCGSCICSIDCDGSTKISQRPSSDEHVDLNGSLIFKYSQDLHAVPNPLFSNAY